HALADDAVALAHFRNTAQVTVVAIAIHAHRHVELDAVVDFVGHVLAKIPLDARTAQHGAGEAHGLGQFRGNHADIDQTLLPDAVVGQQGLVFVDTGRETVGEVFDEIEQRTGSGLVHEADFLLAAVLGVALVLGHGVGKIAIDPARTVVGRVHARPGHRLVDVHEIFALTEGIEEHRHGPHVERVRTERHQVVQNTRDLVEHHADVLGPQGNSYAQQPLNRHDVGVLVAHHGDVVETVHVRQRLQIGTMLGQFFGGTVQQTDVRVSTLNDFAVHLEHQAQHAVRRRVL